jgi:hypothetical protein
VTVAADVGGFLAATAFCEDIARTLSTWNNSAFKSGGPWLSAAQWETRRAVRPAIVWTEATPKTEPHEERWDYQSINEEFDDPNSWRVGARRHARGAVVATALRAKATGWVDGAAKGGPRPSAHLRRYSALENVDVPWWRRFVTVVRSALVADAARELCIGPYDLDADLPNPFERILDVWGLGYVWLGENIDRSGEETRWLAALRPDDFGEGRGGP